MLGVYLSGTGNTKYCIEKLIRLVDNTAIAIPIESKDAAEQIAMHDTIYLAYPTQFSNSPYMVRDFIKKHKELWKGKNVFCIVTMGAFSGDGAGCTARLLRKYGAKIIGGLHIKMPDSVCDVKFLKKSLEDNKELVRMADSKIIEVSEKILKGRYPHNGLSIISHIMGLFCQRLWNYKRTSSYSDKLKISDSCIGCGLCSELCPMNNIKIVDKKAKAGNQCTMCYRCISHCPKQALTLVGDKIIEQCQIEKYL